MKNSVLNLVFLFVLLPVIQDDMTFLLISNVFLDNVRPLSVRNSSNDLNGKETRNNDVRRDLRFRLRQRFLVEGVLRVCTYYIRGK